MDPCCSEGLHLFGGSALASGDDGSGVTHAASRRCSLSRNKAHYRLLHMLLDVLGSGFFCRSADFTNEDDGFGFWVFVQQRERVDMCCPDDGIAADANGRRLADAALRELVDGLVSKGSGTRDDADAAFLVNAAGHDSDLGLAGGDDSGAVGADEARAGVLEHAPDLNH